MGYKMSDIFLKNKKKNGNVSDFLDTESVSTASLPQWLSVVDVPQKGGKLSDLQEVSSATSTTELESKLRQIFNEAEAAEQAGGKRRKRKASKKVDVTEDGKKKKGSKRKGSKKSSKRKGSKKGSKKSSKRKGSRKLTGGK